MTIPAALTGVLKFGLPLLVGGALAGAIAWGATRGSGDEGPLPSGVAASNTQVAEREPTPPIDFSPNDIPPDQDVLDALGQERAALEASGERCPQSYLLYESKNLNGSFCYPPTWKLVFGDRPILPPSERWDGFGAALLLTKNDPATGKEVARVVIQLAGHPPRTREIDCDQPGNLTLDGLTARVCFEERKVARGNSIPADVARIINISIPALLPDSGLPEIPAAVQVSEEFPDESFVRFSEQDQKEGLEIIASIRLNP